MSIKCSSWSFLRLNRIILPEDVISLFLTLHIKTYSQKEQGPQKVFLQVSLSFNKGPGWKSYITWHSKITFIFGRHAHFPNPFSRDFWIMALGPNICTNNDYLLYMNFFGKYDKRICMGQIRHIIAQCLTKALKGHFRWKILFGNHRQSAPHNPYRFFSLNSLYDLNIKSVILTTILSWHLYVILWGSKLSLGRTLSLWKSKTWIINEKISFKKAWVF